MDRGRLERAALKGQQAAVCLTFLNDFENVQRDKLWTAAMSRDAQTVDTVSRCAAFLGMFRDYLISVKNDGLVAEKSLKEDQNNGN